MTGTRDTDNGQLVAEDSWAASVTSQLERSRSVAWIIASAATLVAVLLAVALIVLLPLKTVEPYTLLVDKQTGSVEKLAPLDENIITSDAALTRSFLVQYVIARESYYAETITQDYRKVGLWTTGRARERYIANIQASNPKSPLSFMPRGGTIGVQVRSVSSLSPERSLVRFTTIRTNPGGQAQAPQYWVAVIDYQYSQAAMSEDDRLLNPLGFQVVRYRRNAETLSEAQEDSQAVPPAKTAPSTLEEKNQAETGQSGETEGKQR